ncbi:MAG: hypothetical protein HUJ95_05945, partial [Bacteroidales bacterium]|nr:hypothetical protein [Bacteroidales bacterium]
VPKESGIPAPAEGAEFRFSAVYNGDFVVPAEQDGNPGEDVKMPLSATVTSTYATGEAITLNFTPSASFITFTFDATESRTIDKFVLISNDAPIAGTEDKTITVTPAAPLSLPNAEAKLTIIINDFAATTKGFAIQVWNGTHHIDRTWHIGSELTANHSKINAPLLAFYKGEIMTAADLVDFGAIVNGGYSLERYTIDGEHRLGADINLSSVASWTPVVGFTGTFNGNGKTISNLLIDNTEDIPAGLFSTMTNATVKNLTFSNVNVSSSNLELGTLAGHAENCTISNVDIIGGATSNIVSSARVVPQPTNKYGALYTNDYAVVGGVVGYLKKGTVEDCDIDANVSSNYRMVGGVVGFIDNDEATIKNCSLASTAKVECINSTFAGGIIGSSLSSVLKVSNCECFGTVKARYSYVGGIVATVNSTYFEYCTVKDATITEVESGSGTVGGIAAYIFKGDVTFSNCVVDNADISGGFAIGGILGHMTDKEEGTSMIIKCEVKNGCVITSTNASAYTGGFVGRANTKSTQCAIADSSVEDLTITAAGQQVGGAIGCAQGTSIDLTECEVKTSTITSPGNYIAGLIGCHYAPALTCTNCTIEGCEINATAGNNCSGFVGRATNACTNATFTNPKLIDTDLNLKGQINGGILGYADAKNILIHNAEITDVTITSSGKSNGGLIGQTISGAANNAQTTISDPKIMRLTMSVANTQVGGIIGYDSGAYTIISGAQIYNSELKSSHSIEGTNQNYLGGIVGYPQAGTCIITEALISNTTISGNKSYVGGISGTLGGTAVTIEESVVGSGCTISGTYSVGGISGGAYVPNGFKFLLNKSVCYANINTSSSQVGGLIGIFTHSSALTTPPIATIINSAYLNGEIVSTHAGAVYTGGILGQAGGLAAEGENDRVKVYVVNCYSRPSRMSAPNAVAQTCTNGSVDCISGLVGHIHSATTLYGCYTDVKLSTLSGKSSRTYPVWGLMQDMAIRKNDIVDVYYERQYTYPGGMATDTETTLVTGHIGNDILDRLNWAADIYNSVPLVESTSADSWIEGDDGYPVLSSIITDPDRPI